MHVIGLAPEIFGEKIYDVQPGRLEDIVPPPAAPTLPTAREKLRDTITGEMSKQIIKPVLDDVREKYGSTFRKSDQNRVESRLKAGAEAIVHQHENQYHIEQKRLEQERDEMMDMAETQEDREYVQQDYEKKADEARTDFMGSLQQAITEFEQEAKKEAVKQAETSVKEVGKREQEDRLKDHLRGFSRTIPSFLMAYGDDSVTLETFDQVIPDTVFRDVTSIGLDDFRKLRDGGKYIGSDGAEHSYPGLFDPVVFNDSVKEFLRLREKLANYFDEAQTEDIFDYIKTGVVDVGGGLRGAYAAGVLDWCMDNGIEFDVGVGVSAGSANIASYMARQPRRNLRFYTEFPRRREYMGVYNFMRRHSFLNLDYIYSTLSDSDGERPLDYPMMRSSRMEYYAVATNANNGKARYFGIDSMEGIEVMSCEVTESRLYLKVVNHRLEMACVGDRVQAGVMISNSEVGLGAVAVQPLVYTLACTNGMVVNSLGERKTHVGRAAKDIEDFGIISDETMEAEDKAFTLKLRDITMSAIDVARFGLIVGQLEESAGAKITGRIQDVVEVTGKEYGLGMAEQDGVLKYLIEGGDLSLYGLSNAVTRMSQDVESYDRTTALEGMLIFDTSSSFRTVRHFDGVSPLSPHVSPTFALSQAFPTNVPIPAPCPRQGRTSRYQKTIPKPCTKLFLILVWYIKSGRTKRSHVCVRF